MTYQELEAKIDKFLTVWHESGRKDFEIRYQHLNYDSPGYRKFARKRRKYIALDSGTGGYYLVDINGNMFTIKAYGVPKARIGSLDEMIKSKEDILNWQTGKTKLP